MLSINSRFQILGKNDPEDLWDLEDDLQKYFYNNHIYCCSH